MKSRGWVFLLTGVCFAVSQTASAASEAFLRVAAVSAPPHVTMSEVNPPEGALADFMMKYILPTVAEKFKLTVVWKGAPLKREFRDLEVGDLDMLFMVVKTPEREQKYHFSTEPLITEQPGMIVSKSQFKGRSAISVKELSGKTVGQMAGSLVPDFFKQNNINFITLTGQDVGVRLSTLVENKRIDGVFIHLVSVTDGVIAANKLEKLKSVALEDAPAFSTYVAYNKKLSPEIRAEIDRLIALHRKHYKIK
ncbi:substrate-binding periplasmic protein [Bdellovibrio sp. HCB290]|uniref:substrate-binding periplasmic protein n=1 Tax=Bdellovibrio sp. HCB290 TaxID=3394356 RepID=UPI0039B496E7